jgi:WD40 repeat protein
MRANVSPVQLNNSISSVVSCSSDSSIKIWDIATGECLDTHYLHKDYVKHLRYTDRAPNLLVSSSFDGIIQLLDTNTMKPIQTLASDSSEAWEIEADVWSNPLNLSTSPTKGNHRIYVNNCFLRKNS